MLIYVSKIAYYGGIRTNKRNTETFFHDNNTEFANFMGEKPLQQVDGLVDVEVLEDLSLIKLPTKYQE